MILRAAIVFLLVLNLGIAAWWISGGDTAPERRRAPASLGAPGLRLVSEIAAAKPPAAPAPEAPSTPASATQPVAETVVATTPAAEQCLRIGPFADAAARDAMRPALASFAAALSPRDTPGKSARGWKVYIPAFASREAANAMGEKIKAAGISDWYVMNEGDAANSIALGRYGGEEAARRREAELKAKGIPAQAEALGDSVPQWWFDARLKEGADRAALAAVAPSKTVDCATLR